MMILLNYRRTQAALMETPPSLPEEVQPDLAAARAVVDRALDAGTTLLSEVDAKAILAAYGVPVVRTAFARDAEDAVRQAEAIGYPVALKVVSPEISHKSDVGGVILDLSNAEIRRFQDDMDALGVHPPWSEPRATTAMPLSDITARMSAAVRASG